MKQIFAIVGIAILLLTVVCLSGCQIRDCPNPSENKPIAVGCILHYPDRYLNKVVTIKGTYGENKNINATWVTTPSIHFANVPDILDLVFLEEVNTSVLIAWKDYYFMGIVKEYKNELYLEVSKIEST